MDYSKRKFIKYSTFIASAVAIPLLPSCTKTYDVDGLSSMPDENGLLLPPNCHSRIIARSGNKVKNSDYEWHAAPDGGGVLPTEDGGWIYVSNSEMKNKKGGVGAIQFNSNGDITTSYSILEGTERNCGGCVTPWNTWLSCEEFRDGITWECDPYGKVAAVARPKLGAFTHESIAIDPKTHVLYLTEDTTDSCFYRFLPAQISNGKADLSDGILEIAVVDNNESVTWMKIDDPLAKLVATRRQRQGATKFNGGEGIVYNKGKIFFDTKGDNRIWKYDIQSNRLTLFYDANSFKTPILTGVDTIAVYQDNLFVCEDGGNMQIVAITPQHQIKPILQLVGHDDSEITGVAIAPDKSRLYFNSQRGTTGRPEDAITFEVVGSLI